MKMNVILRGSDGQTKTIKRVVMATSYKTAYTLGLCQILYKNRIVFVERVDSNTWQSYAMTLDALS